MNYEVKTANIEFLPHCSNCGFELDIKDVDYSDLSYSDEKHNKRAKLFEDHIIKPYTCPNCGAHLESILIDFGWYHSQVKNQYKDMIDFIKYLSCNYARHFDFDTRYKLYELCKFYDKPKKE